MATKTYGTTSTTNVGFVTSSNRAIISSFTPDDWGGNTNPQEGRALYTVTKITVYARLGDADPGTNTINVVMGSSTGSFNKADTLAYSTYDGSTQLSSSYKYMAGTVSAVVGSNNEYYGGLKANGPGGAYITRGTASGESTYVVEPSSGNVTYTWSNSQQYLSLEYYGLPNAPSGLTAGTPQQNSVPLSWTAPSTSSIATSASGYVVQYKASSSSTWIDFTTTTSTSASVTGLTAGTAYDFRVAAYDTTIRNVVSNATGPYSSTANATTTSSVPKPEWSTDPFNAGQVSTTYNQDFARATGHDSATYGNISLVSGSLPPGLSGSPSGEYYYVSGTPTADGTYNFTLEAENAGGTSQKAYSIYVSQVSAPTWVDQTLASTATTGARYLDSVSVTGTSITWSYSGTLPPGVYFSAGTLDGYPTTTGSYSFTIIASNSGGSASKSFTITVSTSVLDGGSRMTGDSTSTQLTTYKRYTGSSWTELTTAKRFNGSSWENI